MELMAGDKFIAADNGYKSEMLVVSAIGFNLKDYGEPAHYIVINTKFGSMNSYHESIDEIHQDYKILKIIPNESSVERMQLQKEG